MWYMDSGCSKHMTGRKELLTNFRDRYSGKFKFGNDHYAPIKKVAYVEGFGHNLLSIGQFCDKGLEENFRATNCSVRTYKGEQFLGGTRKSNLYTVKFENYSSTNVVCLLSKNTLLQNLLWHRRLSHFNYANINHLAKSSLVKGLPEIRFEKKQLCSACEMGKMKRASQKAKVEHSTTKPL